MPIAPHAMATALDRPSTSFGLSVPAPSLGQPQPSFNQPAPNFGQPSVLNRSGSGNLAQAPGLGAAFNQPMRDLPFGIVQGGFPATGIITSGPPQPPVSGFPQPNNPFGKISAPPAPANPFGQQPSFGNPPSTQGVFGPTTKQTPNPFGQLNTVKPSPFDLPARDQHPAASRQAVGPMVSSGQASTSASPQPVTQGSSVPVEAKRDSQGKLIAWNGKPVQLMDNEYCYKGNDGSWIKIWFPDGPPIFTKAMELPDEVYDEKTRESYRYLREHGTFKDGLMPELPPRREWCNWNF
jgi:nucleoporin NUP42